MEKILELGKTYKYEIMGAVAICILYIGMKIYSAKDAEKEVIVKPAPESSSSKKELRLLISEMRKMSQGLKEMIDYNKKLNPKDNYFNFRDQYFTRDIEKMRILIDTKSMGPHNDDEHSNTSQYKVLFGYSKGGEPIPQNTICFGEKLNDVVGFRLTRATIPDTLYNVTTTNQEFHFKVNDGVDILVGTLRQGAYSFQSLAVEFAKALNDATGSPLFTITSDVGSFKYTLSYTGSGSVIFYWSRTDNQVHKLVGGSGDTETISIFPYTFRNTVDHSIHFVDLVIPEIPSIATKIGANGSNIVDRIPLSGIRGNLITYIPLEEGTPWTQNYFYPININQLSITLYDDTSSNLLKNNNNDHMLEFEIAMLKNTKLLK